MDPNQNQPKGREARVLRVVDEVADSMAELFGFLSPEAQSQRGRQFVKSVARNSAGIGSIGAESAVMEDLLMRCPQMNLFPPLAQPAVQGGAPAAQAKAICLNEEAQDQMDEGAPHAAAVTAADEVDEEKKRLSEQVENLKAVAAQQLEDHQKSLAEVLSRTESHYNSEKEELDMKAAQAEAKAKASSKELAEAKAKFEADAKASSKKLAKAKAKTKKLQSDISRLLEEMSFEAKKSLSPQQQPAAAVPEKELEEKQKQTDSGDIVFFLDLFKRTCMGEYVLPWARSIKERGLDRKKQCGFRALLHTSGCFEDDEGEFVLRKNGVTEQQLLEKGVPHVEILKSRQEGILHAQKEIAIVEKALGFVKPQKGKGKRGSSDTRREDEVEGSLESQPKKSRPEDPDASAPSSSSASADVSAPAGSTDQ